MAESLARTFNCQPMGGPKRSRYAEDLWTLKFLRGFHWADLTDKIAYEKQVRSTRIREEMSAAKRDSEYYEQQVKRGQQQEKRGQQQEKRGQQQERRGQQQERRGQQQEKHAEKHAGKRKHAVERDEDRDIGIGSAGEQRPAKRAFHQRTLLDRPRAAKTQQ